MSKQLSATETIYAEHKRSAPRLDLEFMMDHTRTVPMPYAILQACMAEHAACVRDEPKGRNHGKHAATVRALTSQYREYRARKVGTVAYFAPMFTADEYTALDCIESPDRAFDMACELSADLAYEYADRRAIADATAAYADLAMRGRYTWDTRNDKAAA